MGYNQFLSFIDKAAHVDPGYKYKTSDRRRYQKIITNAIFGNQLIAGGIFDDTNDRFQCEKGTLIALVIVFGCLILILIIIIYSLRQTCHDLQDRLRRPRVVSVPMVPIVPPPLPLPAITARESMVITPIDEEDEAADTDSDIGGVGFDFPPSYSSVTEGQAEPMGRASAPNESSVGDDNSDQRPYPFMLPDNYTVSQPITVVSTHAE